MKQLLTLNPENLGIEATKDFETREAARAVIFDTDQNVAILHVTKLGFHKLPGGGVEKNETIEQALHRECQEEVGCGIEIIQGLGSITEYRKKYQLKQISYCYLARLAGEKGVPHMDPGEIADGFQVMWIPLENAIELISHDRPEDYEGQFIVKRDLAFLLAAKN